MFERDWQVFNTGIQIGRNICMGLSRRWSFLAMVILAGLETLPLAKAQVGAYA